MCKSGRKMVVGDRFPVPWAGRPRLYEKKNVGADAHIRSRVDGDVDFC